MATIERAVVLGPGEGEAIEALGLSLRIKVRGADTGGAWFAFEVTYPPGHGIAPHIHHREEEAIVFLEGELETQVGDERMQAQAGSFQLIPRGTVHAQSNTSEAPARALLIFSPPGLEGFVDEVAGETDPARAAELFAKYGTEFVSP